MKAPDVWTIAPGAPFLETFADALLSDQIIPGIAADPLILARTKIYVPTQRSARALAQHFSVRLASRGVLLPKIVPLGAIEDNGDSQFFDEDAGFPDIGAVLDPAIGETERRLILTRLIMDWSKALRHAIISVDANGTHELDPGEALLVATTPADAWHLSGDLAGLIDELAIEGKDWGEFEPLVTDSFDKYWRITLDFLKIAVRQWPEILQARQLMDGARRRAQLIKMEIADLMMGGDAPIVAAGSTGTNRATAELLAAIARAPRGAVVLPGLDLRLDDASWRAIGGDVAAALEPAAGHPQAALARLLKAIGIERSGVKALGALAPALGLRERFVSEAMRPAETTDQWHSAPKQLAVADIKTALAGMTLIEAADEREEALALAIVLRQTLEVPGATAALITPDRNLAQRVRAELLRWNIKIEDSGGESLRQTPAGSFAMLALECCARNFGAIETLALLKHGACRLGLSRSMLDACLPALEIGALRSLAANGGLGDTERVMRAARAAAQDRHAHDAARRIDEAQWNAAEDVLARLVSALRPLTGINDAAPLTHWAELHFAALLALTGGDENISSLAGADAASLVRVFEDLAASGQSLIAFDLRGYAAFFERLSGDLIVRGHGAAHPRLKILGLLEARLIDADVILLGGLDETIWPPQARTDAFLNRPMRAQLGLSPPERRIGQTAHDFTQSLGKSKIIMSRALKRARTPTVASRFLQRMTALAGDDQWRACLERGRALLDWAQRLDQPDRESAAIKPPRPCPPLSLRPKALSVTRIETLRRDPYAIYAGKILRLAPLEALGLEISARDFGNWLHEALAQFCKAHSSGPLPAEAQSQLIALARQTFAAVIDEPEFQTFKWPQLTASLLRFLDWEGQRRGAIANVFPETSGSLAIQLADGTSFKLSANADRIERAASGAANIFDYKTGAVPSRDAINAGFAPQLSLEAAILLGGGFGDIGGVRTIEELTYVKFGSAAVFDIFSALGKDGKAETMAARDLSELTGLLSQFRDIATPYLSRPFPQFIARYSDYDHLARVQEWSADSDDEAAT